MTSSMTIGLLAELLGCLCVYMASGNQCWRRRAWPAGPSRIAGGLLLAGGLALLWRSMQPIAAVSLFAVWLMLLLALLPYLGALLALCRHR